ncbi:hypothetical protein Ciccas_012133 [Cichlidogyrus casuarinus]|uniref:Uncharacterized protein n=1 Tax=Cichlidogyrus casuarinus TaxID=1844966 RepID=A0ABD2PU72_9PLAT
MFHKSGLLLRLSDEDRDEQQANSNMTKEVRAGDERRMQFEAQVTDLLNWLETSVCGLEISAGRESRSMADNELLRQIIEARESRFIETSTVKGLAQALQKEMHGENTEEIDQLYEDLDQRWSNLDALVKLVQQKTMATADEAARKQLREELQAAEKELAKEFRFKNSEQLEDNVMYLSDMSQRLKDLYQNLAGEEDLGATPFAGATSFSVEKAQLDATEQEIESKITLMHDLSAKHDKFLVRILFLRPRPRRQ